MRVGLAGVFLPLALLALACGSTDEDAENGSGGTGPAASGSLEVGELCDAFIADACSAIFTCPELGKLFDYRDEAHCRSDLPCRGYSDFELEVADGWVRYDPEQMGACHAALQADLCGAAERLMSESLQGVLMLCPEPPEGLQQPGSRCYNFLDCADGSYCNLSAACPGTCRLFQEVGAVCAEDDPMRQCNELAGHICVNGRCQQRFSEGESCADDWYGCAEGLLCGTQIDHEAFCEPLGQIGSDCTGNNHCQEGLICYAPDPSQEQEICGERLSEGAACDWSSQCQEGLACRDGSCGASLGAGEPCRTSLLGGDDCGPALICEDDVCKTARYPGESCGGALEKCAESICVDGTCGPRKADGESCESSYECRSRSCSDTTCVDPSLC